jgi:hypothetical protein
MSRDVRRMRTPAPVRREGSTVRHGDLPFRRHCTSEHSPLLLRGRGVGGEGSPSPVHRGHP